MKLNRAKALLLVPAIGLLAGCGIVQATGSGALNCNSNRTTCSASFGYSQHGTPAPDNSVSASSSIPGAEPSSSPAPTVTVIKYIDIVQQCLPDPTENQLEALASLVNGQPGNVPSCLDLSQGQEQVFVTIINNDLEQTPRSEFHSQQGRDNWRDHQLAAAVQQAQS